MHAINFDIQKAVVAKWIGYFALFDLLVLPYFQFIIIPYSLPVIIVGLLLLGIESHSNQFWDLFLLISFSVMLSLASSIFLPPYSQSLIYNFKSALQLLTSFFYFFYFQTVGKMINFNIKPFLVVFIAWFSMLGVSFLNNPISTNDFIRAIYGRLINSNEAILEDYRFCYIFQDPNTAIYFFLIALSLLLMTVSSIAAHFALVAIGTMMVIICQSTGGLIAFIVMLSIVYLPKVKRVSLSVTRLLIALIMTVFFVGGICYFVNITKENVVLEFAIKRQLGGDNRYQGGGGRFKHWEVLASNLYPMPIGRGYNLHIENHIEPPHSDFFGLLYRYGFLALMPCLVFLFSKYRTTAPLLIPAAVTFGINSLLDEQKLLALYLSLLAIVITMPANKYIGNK